MKHNLKKKTIQLTETEWYQERLTMLQRGREEGRRQLITSLKQLLEIVDFNPDDYNLS